MICAVSVFVDGCTLIFFVNTTLGHLGDARGPVECGMDRVFYPDDSKAQGKSYAELTSDEKYGVCDRTKAYINALAIALRSLSS